MRLGEHRGLLKRRWKTVLPTNSAEDPNILCQIHCDRLILHLDSFLHTVFRPHLCEPLYDFGTLDADEVKGGVHLIRRVKRGE